MPYQQPNFTGSGIGQTVGRYGLGAFGLALGGPIGGLLGRAVGGPLGGLVGGGLSSLFGPHGLQAIGNPGGGGQAQPLRGISMLIGNRGTPLSYTGPNNLFGAPVPGGAAPSGVGYSGGTPGFSSVSPMADNYARTPMVSVSNQGPQAFARTNTQNILARNII